MSNEELGFWALVAILLLVGFVVTAIRRPDAITDVFNVIKVVLLALVGKKRSEREVKPKKKRTDE